MRCLEIPLLSEIGQIHILVREKSELEAKLLSAGGKDYFFLLEDCQELSEIIEDIKEISSKRSEKERAAFMEKVKFSRKIRRKAKDLAAFERRLVSEYENKRISLSHGRKMVEIIKLLRSSKLEEAQGKAGEFHSLLEMRERLALLDEQLSKKRAQAERARRVILEKISDISWLEEQPPIDMEKIRRHEQGERLREILLEARLEMIHSLQSMPLCELFGKYKEGELEKLGFPQIPAQEIDALSSFLKKSGLEKKSSLQLYEMLGFSKEKLSHLGIDLASFRQNVEEHKSFLLEISSLHLGDFLTDLSPDSASLSYLAKNSPEAKKAVDELALLSGTFAEDEKEWERRKFLEEKKKLVGGEIKPELEKLLEEIESVEMALNGKEGEGKKSAEKAPDEKEDILPTKTGKEKGFLESFFGLFREK